MINIYTHKDLAALCTVSETTIKSYRRKFPGFIPVLTKGKPIRFKKEAGDVCLMIRDCFEKGMSVTETTKVLKQHFKEQPVKRTKKPRQTQEKTQGVVFSEEYLENFFKTAGKMMQGMASLATAQAKSNQRLEKLEKSIKTLIESESQNTSILISLLEQQKSAHGTSTAEASEKSKICPNKTEKKVTRKIVNVETPEGKVKSYAFEKMEEKKSAQSETPPEAFTNTPVVIMNEQGEFLGVPGRLSLAGFIQLLTREAEEGGVSKANWYKEDANWIFSMEIPGGDSHDLYFMSTTTPRGNLVVLLDRLDVNGKETSPQFLQEFFKQVKDRA